MLGDTRARSRFATIGPWIALAVLGAVVAPQVAFLMEANMLPIDYALARAAPDRSGSAARFRLAQLADHALFLAVAAAVGLFGTGAARRSRSEADARRFLLVMGLGPVLLAVAVSVVTGMGLKSMWGMPMFNLSGLLLLALLPLIADRPVRHGKFQWTESVSALPIRLSWATIPAGGTERHRNGSTGR